MTHELLAHIQSEAALTLALLRRIPDDAELWQPDWPPNPRPPFTVRHLAWHLCDAFSGFCAVLARLGVHDFPELRERVESGRDAPLAASIQLLEDLATAFQAAAAPLTDDILARSIPTVFLPQGKPALTLVLTNLAHFTSHKYQLFVYLKILNVEVTTRDLYVFDEPPPPTP